MSEFPERMYYGDDGFHLAFLRPGEFVRSAGDGTGAVVLMVNGTQSRVEFRSWLVRGVDGSITVESAAPAVPLGEE